MLTASAQKQTLSKGQMMYSPRLVGDNYDYNMSLAYQFTTYATKIGLTPAQLALVWLLHQGKDIVPLVGMTTPKHLQTNINAVEFKLNDQQLSELNNLIPVDSIKGERYAPALMPFVAN
ncbi:aldo/keto reductase [Pseudoalteromonas shioyasakiensis]|nr:aldo/keto reductase [Pseudoalteromonas shioyasakiensis]